MIRTIKLYGALAKDTGVSSIDLDVNSPIELANGLRSQVKGFRKATMDYPNLYLILSDRNNENVSCVTPDSFQFPLNEKAEVLHLTNEIEGAGIEAGVIAIFTAMGASAAVAATLATIAINMAISFALGAIANMLAPSPKTGSGQDGAEEKRSFIYNGAVNVMEQGYPVPLVYGIHMTGSVVVSAGVDVAEMAYVVAEEGPPANGGGSTQPAVPPAVAWQPGDGGS